MLGGGERRLEELHEASSGKESRELKLGREAAMGGLFAAKAKNKHVVR